MSHFYLKLTLSITLIFFALSLIAHAVGMTQPSNPALRGFTEGCEDKPQPCWYGIVPGVMTLEEVKSLFAERGYTFAEFRDEERDTLIISAHLLKPHPECGITTFGKTAHEVVTLIEVMYCSDVYIGDFVQTYDHLSINNYCSNFGLASVSLIYFADDDNPFNNFSFEDDLEFITQPISPTQRVSIAYFGDYSHPINKDLQSWQGFIPKQRYCAGYFGYTK